MKEISLFVIWLLLISIVSGEDVTCKPGYGVGIFTSGSASQVCGISKITTWQECKLAAEYNSKNNIDKNRGYGGRVSSSGAPPGCFYFSVSGSDKKYYWNTNTKSTRKCSNSKKCICKTKTCSKCPITCIKCPINTYSEGGTNPTCTPCPKDTPYTATNLNIFTSINSCAAEEDPLNCEAGTGYIHNEDKTHVRVSGTCIYNITTVAECKLAAEYNSKNNIDKNRGFIKFSKLFNIQKILPLSVSYC